MIRVSPAARWAVTPKAFEVLNDVITSLLRQRTPPSPCASQPAGRHCSEFRLSRIRAESGQAVPFLAIFLVVLFGMAAFVIDLGRAYFADRAIQASADAAALAGALELPDDATAVSVAQQYSGSAGAKNEQSNVPGVVTTATTECRAGWPCNPVNAVVVEQTAEVDTYFARVLGIDSIPINARAVALARPGDSPFAIFAYDDDCGGFGFKSNASNLSVDGAIRSNGDFEVNGDDIHADWASAHGTPCTVDINGASIDFGGNPEPEYDPSLHPWPRWFEQSEFSCTYTGNKFEFNTDGMSIPDGVYCASELFKVDGNFNDGNITVLAPEISINGTGHVFRPFALDVLFFATGSKEMILNGFAYDWEGIIFHPGGRVKVNGDENSVLTGMIEALEVEVNGSEFNLVGTGPSAGGKRIQLIE